MLCLDGQLVYGECQRVAVPSEKEGWGSARRGQSVWVHDVCGVLPPGMAPMDSNTMGL